MNVDVLCVHLQYAFALGEYLEKEKIANLKVWTSELQRTKATARHVDAPVEHWKALNEIDAVSYIFSILTGSIARQYRKHPRTFNRQPYNISRATQEISMLGRDFHGLPYDISVASP